MQRTSTYVIVTTVLLLIVAACGGADRDREAVVDDLGREVRLVLPAERVATLAPSLTEIVYAVGAGGRLVGAGKPDNYPPAVDTLPRYSTYPLDFEALTALGPDLVLATDQVNSPRSAETLAAVGIPTYFLSFRSLDDVFDGMETIGHLLASETRAEAAVDSLRRRVDALRRRTDDIEKKPLVLLLVGQETLFSFGEESYIHEIIELAGGESVTRDIRTTAPILSEEYVLTQSPDVIIGPWADSVDAGDLLQHHPAWDILPAIAARRVYAIHPDLVSRPGPRLVEGAYEIARRLHPDRFDDHRQPSLD